jgi:hypothetical protein
MKLEKRRRLIGSRVVGFVLISTMAFAGSLPTLAAEPVTVFGANPTVVRLDKLSPPLTEGLRAILAMYTLQSGAGCEDPVPDKKLSCALNTALKVGPQCSDAQLQLVGAWFKSVPKMSGTRRIAINTSTYNLPVLSRNYVCRPPMMERETFRSGPASK